MAPAKKSIWTIDKRRMAIVGDRQTIRAPIKHPMLVIRAGLGLMEGDRAEKRVMKKIKGGLRIPKNARFQGRMRMRKCSTVSSATRNLLDAAKYRPA